MRLILSAVLCFGAMTTMATADDSVKGEHKHDHERQPLREATTRRAERGRDPPSITDGGCRRLPDYALSDLEQLMLRCH